VRRLGYVVHVLWLLLVMVGAGGLVSPAHATGKAAGQAVAQAQTPSVEARAGGAGGGGLVRTDTLQSAALGRSVKYRVILPADYDQDERRYPTLYLLHGLYGAFSDWESRTDLLQFSRPYPFIIVTPEGENAWYTDSAGEASEKFETYIIADLIPAVDERYRTIKSRHARAIAGLSMGGYGALKFGLKYPGLFSTVGSFSGALSVARDEFRVGEDRKVNEHLRRIYGNPGSPPRAANDVYTLAEKAVVDRLPYIYMDCGSADWLLTPNRELAAILQKRGIAYEYHEVPGGHTWDYWDRQIRVFLNVLAERLPR